MMVICDVFVWEHRKLTVCATPAMASARSFAVLISKLRITGLDKLLVAHQYLLASGITQIHWM